MKISFNLFSVMKYLLLFSLLALSRAIPSPQEDVSLDDIEGKAFIKTKMRKNIVLNPNLDFRSRS